MIWHGATKKRWDVFEQLPIIITIITSYSNSCLLLPLPQHPNRKHYRCSRRRESLTVTSSDSAGDVLIQRQCAVQGYSQDMCRLSAVSTSLPATVIGLLVGRAVSCTLLLVPKYAMEDLLGFRSNPFNQNLCCRSSSSSVYLFNKVQ